MSAKAVEPFRVETIPVVYVSHRLGYVANPGRMPPNGYLLIPRIPIWLRLMLIFRRYRGVSTMGLSKPRVFHAVDLPDSGLHVYPS